MTGDPPRLSAAAVGKVLAGQSAALRRPLRGFLFRATVTVALFAFIVWHADPGALLQRLAGIHLTPILLTAVVLAAQFLVSAWRWHRIAGEVAGQPPTFASICLALGASHFYGQVLPSTVGGDVVRTVMLSRQIGKTSATLSVILDRLTGLLVLALLIVILTPFLAWRIGDGSALAGPLVQGLSVGAGFLALLFADKGLSARWLPQRVRELARLGPQLRRAIVGPRLRAVVVGCGLLTQLASVTLVYLLSEALGAGLAFRDCLLLVPPALLVAAVPVSLNGWGIREGALAAGFGLLGVPVADVLPVSILYGLTGPAMGLVYGAVALLLNRPPPQRRSATLQAAKHVPSERNEDR